MTGTRRVAHHFVDFLWDRLNISAGAFALIMVSILFTIAVYKIDNNNIDSVAKVSRGVCHVIDQSNRNIGAAKSRIIQATNRDRQAADIDRHIARSLIRLDAPGIGPIIQGELAQARLSDAAADDLQSQLGRAKPIVLPGCPS